MVRVYINGITGRMGVAAEKAVGEDPELQLVGGGGRTRDLKAAIAETKPDVVLDLTVAEVAVANAECILSSGTAAVLGTSGFSDSEVSRLQTLAKEKGVGGVIAPNFAIGAVLMMMFAEKAATYLPDVEIIEMHHDRKQDAPSGTAQRTAELIAKSIRANGATPSPNVPLAGRAFNVDGIGIHSVRLPGLVAHQQIIFGGSGQMLTIRHDSLNRESFMPGVCLACKRAPSMATLEYGLEHVLGTW